METKVYYRLVNTKFNTVLKLSHNETDMKTVIEDVVLYASIDNEEPITIEEFPALLEKNNLRVEVSHEPFVFEDKVISTYNPQTIEKPAPYKPKGRIYSSNSLTYM